MDDAKSKQIIAQLKKTGFSFIFSEDELNELGALFSNADDNVIQTATKSIKTQDKKYQQKIKQISNKEAYKAAEELSIVIQKIKAGQQKKIRKKEALQKQADQNILADLENKLQ